ncbi:MAG: hypothetical protein LBD09_00790, partial [Treponema sp.]|nr:hypothetical protein [Treponema sp.]
MAAIVLATINAKWIHPSLALRLLKANLDGGPGSSLADEGAAGCIIDCTILELALRQSLKEKTAALLEASPAILGFSVSIWNHQATEELLGALEAAWETRHETGQARRPPPVIVLGGPELTFLPRDTPLFDHADFVLRGEGEEVFPRLCRAILEDRDRAKKTWGRFIDAPAADLAELKSPYGLYTEEDLGQKLIYVESSRGCPYTCAFCQSAVKPAAGNSPPVREFPLEPFLAGLEELLDRIVRREQTGKAPPPRTIKFLDRSFNLRLPRALSILEFCLAKTEAARRTGVSLEFHFELVPSLFSPELGAALARFPPGSLRLEAGVQSLNPRTRGLIQRVSSPEGELETLRFLRTRTAAAVHADLIAGLPGEDLASFGEGFDRLWIALGAEDSAAEIPANDDSAAGHTAPREIQPGILKCLPGTPIRDMADRGAFTVEYRRTAPYEVIATESLSRADMDRIKNFARLWELIVNRRAFPDLLPRIAPPGKPVFWSFMELSRRLFDLFGRNWGIPKDQLREAAEGFINQPTLDT